MADILFGIVNPSGKLAETFQLEQHDAPADGNFPGQHRQVQYREGLYVGYRYFDSADAPVLFPFGHGLSYTVFDYGTATTDQTAFHQGQSLNIRVEITNSGQRAGAEIVQHYDHALAGEVYRPAQELRAFQKVWLQPNESKTLSFSLHDDAFAFFDQGHQAWVVEAGTYEIRFAASSRDIRSVMQIQVESAQTVSEQARTTKGPDLTQASTVSDDQFADMLGKKVPAAEASRPFHENSSLSEVGESWLGAKFKARVVEGFKQSMGGNGSDETLNKMFEEMANNMPLRALALFSGGEMSMAQIRLVLAVLNHRYLHAVKLWLKSR